MSTEICKKCNGHGFTKELVLGTYYDKRCAYCDGTGNLKELPGRELSKVEIAASLSFDELMKLMLDAAKREGLKVTVKVRF